MQTFTEKKKPRTQRSQKNKTFEKQNQKMAYERKSMETEEKYI